MAHGEARPQASAGPPPASPSSASSASVAVSQSAYANEAMQRRAGASGEVAVIGAGFLGRCIALDLSLLGVRVVVYDTNPQTANSLSTFAYELMNPMLHLGYVTKSMITRACTNVRVVSDLRECANADIVIEAIPEDLEAKVKLLRSLEAVVSASTVLATSTIELSVDAIQERLKHRERFLGVRFFHPCVLLPPVEITPGAQTDDRSVERVVAFLSHIQKEPHRGPTRRVLSNREVSAFQFNTAVRGRFYHGLLDATVHPIDGVIVPAAGPPLVADVESHGTTTSL